MIASLMVYRQHASAVRNEWVDDVATFVDDQKRFAMHAFVFFVPSFIATNAPTFWLFFGCSRIRGSGVRYTIEMNTKQCFLHESMAVILRSNPGYRAIANLSKRNRP